MSFLKYKNIYFVPSFHNKIQFAFEVRKAFSEIKPDIVAIELPDIYYSDVIKAVDFLPSLTMLCIESRKNSFEYIPIFPSDAMIEGIRISKENKIPITFIDLAIKNYKVLDDFEPPDDYAIKTIGLEKFYETVKNYLKKSDSEDDIKREESMAFHLSRLNMNYKKILFIGGMAHWENIKAHIDNKSYKFHTHEFELIKVPFLATPSKKSLYSFLEEIPYLVFKYELARRFNLDYDKWDCIVKLLQEVKAMPIFEDENYTSRELQSLIDYSKKLTFNDNKILPDLFNLLLSAKQTLGDDFALEFIDLALSYKFESDKSLRVIDFDDKNFTLDGKKIKLKRKMPSYFDDKNNLNKWKELKLVRKKREEIDPEYINEWFSFGFFSHEPEDVILEGFIDRTENKLKSEILEEPKIHEFTGNLMDGINIRESIRDFHKKKLYVKEFKKEKIDIGCWLIIFDDNLTFEKYPWEMSLSSEQNDESDIAFYATNPFRHPISNEIIRADYGALLAFKPALEDNNKIYSQDLDTNENERLWLLFNLALEFNTTDDILYIAEKPPEKIYYDFAKYRKKRIFYLQLSSFSSRNIKKLRKFHLLKSKKTRNIADDYI